MIKIDDQNVIFVDGYIAFYGSMKIDMGKGKSLKAIGNWLFNPKTKLWSCDGKKFSKDKCEIFKSYLEDRLEILDDGLHNKSIMFVGHNEYECV